MWEICAPSTSASAMMIILSYRSFVISKSLPYPSENPHPNALIMVLISAFARTLSMLAFSHVQDLSTDRQDCLIHSVAGSLCASSRRISLNDEDFTFGCIPALTVGKLTVTVKRIFLPGQKIRLCLFLGLTDLCCFFCTGKNLFQCLQIPVNRNAGISSLVTFPVAFAASWLSSFVLVCPSNLGSGCLIDTIAVIPFRTSAPVKLASYPLTHPISRAYWFMIVVKCRLEPGQMGSPFRIINIVAET